MVITQAMKRLLQQSLNRVGFEVRRVSPERCVPTADRRDLGALLRQAQRIGLAPQAVVDVGAAHGLFTRECATIFPAARYILIEPLEEYRASLEQTIGAIGNAELIQAAASTGTSSTCEFHVHRDLVGSSLYLEQEDSDVNGVPRTVPAVTLDLVRDRFHLKGPFLLKVDVQGAELDVLTGATSFLQDTEYALLEVSLFEFFRGGPQLADIVAFMKARGFVAYDLYNPLYRPIDAALSQLDIAFVKERGLFRRVHAFATREQRAAQDRHFAPMGGSLAKPPQ